MTAKLFVDTNILIYAHDIDAGEKHSIAQKLIMELWENRLGVLSIQVLQEFYVNVTRKIADPLTPAQARSIIDIYSHWELVLNSAATILRGSEIQERYKLSFWESLIVASAMEAGVD